MKKLQLITLALILSFSLTACGKKKEPEKIVKNHGPYDNKGFEVLDNNTIEGWLNRLKTVECKIETAEGTVSAKIKDGKVRIDGIPYISETGTSEGLWGVELTIGDTIYRWDSLTKTGVKIDALKLKAETASITEITKEQMTWADRAATWDASGVTYNCAEANLIEADFAIPNDVTFTEMAQ